MKKRTGYFKFINNFVGNSRGASIIEFALIAPVFLMFVMYILELGYVMILQNALDAGVRAGGRYGITQAASSGSGRQANIEAQIRITVQTFSGGWIKSSSPNLVIYASSSPTLQNNAGVTAGSSSTGTNANYGIPGYTVNYLVVYTFNSFIPLFGLSNSVKLQAESTFVTENPSPS